MKIGLISPKANFFGTNNEFNELWSSLDFLQTYKKHWSGLSQALLIVASLTPENHNIEVIDENIQEIDFSKDFDLVGISATTQQSIRAYEIADLFREKGTVVVIGGIHATVLPEEAKKHADSVVIGEAEGVWEELFSDFVQKHLKPFYKSKIIEDLGNVPIPKYELIKDNNYPVIWIQATRGCPHDCEFCCASRIFGAKYRKKPLTNVLEEIESVLKNFKNVIIGFGDDNLFVNREWSKKLLKALIPLNLRYYAQSDISIAQDEELLELMRKSGCINVFIGFESIDEKCLESINSNRWKLNNLKHYSDYIQKIQRHGIGVMGAFIIGYDYDDKETISKLSNFIIENNLYEAQICILTPLPGTKLREKLSLQNRILQTGWDNYSMWNANFIHPNLTKDELESGIVEIYKRIHSQDVYAKKAEYFKQIQKDLIKRGLA